MTPLPFQWNGEAMVIQPGFQRQADQQFVIGESYRMATIEDRSDATHKHEFAFLGEAWINLPEALSDQFPTPEHLRKRALIDTGFYSETLIDVGTVAGALRVASYARGEDDFAHVVTRGSLVVVRKAKSQSRRAMDKAEFQASKTALIDYVSALIGVAPDILARAA